MRIKKILQRLMAAFTLTVAVTGSTVAVAQAPALATRTECRTIQVNGDWWAAINPRMDVPICYNGLAVWQNGPTTPNVTTVGYYVNGITWHGTYGSGNWLGAGMNLSATLWTNAATVSCSPRWGINAWGKVISYNRNC